MPSKAKSTATKEEAKPALVPKLRFPEFRGKNGWEIRALGDLATFSSGGTPSKDVPEYWNGHIPWISASSMYDTDICDSEHKISTAAIGNGTRIAKAGSLLILTRGSMLFNRVPLGIASIDVAFNQDVRALKIDEEICNSFLMWQLISQECRIPINETGIGAGKIDTDDLRRFPVAIPTLLEQQKIASCLSSLDELISAQARKVEEMRTHKKGLMQQLFPREGETQPRLRFPEFQNAGEWERQTLADVARISSGTTPLRSNAEFFTGGTIPWVKTTDLNNSFIAQTEEYITPKTRARVNPIGSVLVAMYGGFNQIGRTGCLSVPAATNQALSVLVLDRTRAIPPFVLSWLNAKVDNWKRIASSSRKDPNITGTDVAKFPIALPSTAEQRRIATCISSLDALIAAETQKHAALLRHKRGLMQQLFPSPESNVMIEDSTT